MFLPLLPSSTPQGIVGNLASGKSALVHRYLTGTYVQEESPEGKRIHHLASPHLLSSSPLLSKIRSMIKKNINTQSKIVLN